MDECGTVIAFSHFFPCGRSSDDLITRFLCTQQEFKSFISVNGYLFIRNMWVGVAVRIKYLLLTENNREASH